MDPSNLWLIALMVLVFLIANSTIQRLDIVERTKERNSVVLTISLSAACGFLVVEWLAGSKPIAGIVGVALGMITALIILAKYPRDEPS